MAHAPLEQRIGEPDDLVDRARSGAAGERLADGGDEPLEVPRPQGREQVVARREVEVHGALRDPRRVGDLGDRGIEPPFDEEILSGVEDLRAAELGRLAPA